MTVQMKPLITSGKDQEPSVKHATGRSEDLEL